MIWGTMKERLLKVFRFALGSIILTTVASLILSEFSGSFDDYISRTYVFYIITYLSYPLLKKYFHLNNQHGLIYFTLLFFVLCLLYFIFFVKIS